MRCVPTEQVDPAPTRFGLHGRTMARPYDIVLCVFGGRVCSDERLVISGKLGKVLAFIVYMCFSCIFAE